ncbi:hypothetical protein [Thorsellia kenyensis]|uniref:Uncharacterized protein n=1 Tax=Thorsellia kenyensis TaxID=1549888 RepID=A0ABV6CCD3_9GAMM
MKQKIKAVLFFTFSPILTGLFLLLIILCFLLVENGALTIKNSNFMTLIFDALSVIAGFSLGSFMIGFIPATLVGIIYVNTVEMSIKKQNCRCTLFGFLFTSPISIFMLLMLNSNINNNYAMSNESIDLIRIALALTPSLLGAFTAFCVSYCLNKNPRRRRLLMY